MYVEVKGQLAGELVLPLRVSPEDETWVIKLGSRYLCLTMCLIDPIVVFERIQ